MQADIDNKQLTILLLFSTDFLRTNLRVGEKVRRNPLQKSFSLKINTPFLITQMAEVALMSETFRYSATSATCRFYVPK